MLWYLNITIFTVFLHPSNYILFRIIFSMDIFYLNLLFKVFFSFLKLYIIQIYLLRWSIFNSRLKVLSWKYRFSIKYQKFIDIMAEVASLYIVCKFYIKITLWVPICILNINIQTRVFICDVMCWYLSDNRLIRASECNYWKG